MDFFQKDLCSNGRSGMDVHKGYIAGSRNKTLWIAELYVNGDFERCFETGDASEEELCQDIGALGLPLEIGFINDFFQFCLELSRTCLLG